MDSGQKKVLGLLSRCEGELRFAAVYLNLIAEHKKDALQANVRKALTNQAQDLLTLASEVKEMVKPYVVEALTEWNAKEEPTYRVTYRKGGKDEA